MRRFVIFTLMLLFATAPKAVIAAIPNLLAWQGVALDSTGAPLADGNYTIHFAVYSDSTGGDSLWGESQLVPIADGVINVLIGSVVPIPDSLFDDVSRYLQVQFGTEAPYVPRTRIVAVGYAFRVASVNGASGGTILGDVSIQSDLDLNGDLRITGKASLGPSVVAGGVSAFAAGSFTQANGDYSSVTGGQSNRADTAFATIGGGLNNVATGFAAVLGGGEEDTASGDWSVVAGGYGNKASGAYSFAAGQRATATADHAVSLGWLNFATANQATVSGGFFNMATGVNSCVTGGQWNIAAGNDATVAGGAFNSALANKSLAAGFKAKANHGGSVVIAATDGTGAPSDSVRSGSNGQMVLRAADNFYLTDLAELAPAVAGRFLNTSTGAYLTDGGTWTNSSDKARKENFTSIDRGELLEKIAQLTIERWNYKNEDPHVQHIGPTAQDFESVFELGSDRKSISTIDPSGIALAAIQELHRRTERIHQLESELAELKSLIAAMQDYIGYRDAGSEYGVLNPHGREVR